MLICLSVKCNGNGIDIYHALNPLCTCHILRRCPRSLDELLWCRACESSVKSSEVVIKFESPIHSACVWASDMERAGLYGTNKWLMWFWFAPEFNTKQREDFCRISSTMRGSRRRIIIYKDAKVARPQLQTSSLLPIGYSQQSGWATSSYQQRKWGHRRLISIVDARKRIVGAWDRKK